MPRRAPQAIYRRRLAACRAAMRAADLPALLITNRVDHVYLVGFTGEDSAVLVTPRQVQVISDGRFATSIAAEVPWAAVTLRRGTLVAEIVAQVRRYRLRRMGVQASVMPVATRDALRRGLRGIRVIDAPEILAEMRLAKDADERAVLIRAVQVAQAAYRATLKTIRVGQTEQEIAARLEYELKRRGSSCPAFPSIVAADANAALPHAVPGHRRVRRGSVLLIDWGATCDFYHSDLTRTVFIHSIPARLEPAYRAVRDAQRKAIAAMRPGVKMHEVDAVARRHIADAGFEGKFTHGLGHGLGLDVHEPPSLNWRSDQPLAEGMVVTVEPGVYLPGIGGIRIEDDVLVTGSGARVLSSLSRALASAVLKP